MLLAQKPSCFPTSSQDPPPCFTIWWICWGPTYFPSPIQHHDLLFELNLFIFVLSLKITFPIIKDPILKPLSKPQACENMFMTQKWLPLLHLCTQSNLSQSMPHRDVKQQLTCLRSNLFWCHKCSSKMAFNNESDTTPLLSGLQEALDTFLFVS